MVFRTRLMFFISLTIGFVIFVCGDKEIIDDYQLADEICKKTGHYRSSLEPPYVCICDHGYVRHDGVCVPKQQAQDTESRGYDAIDDEIELIRNAIRQHNRQDSNEGRLEHRQQVYAYRNPGGGEASRPRGQHGDKHRGRLFAPDVTQTDPPAMYNFEYPTERETGENHGSKHRERGRNHVENKHGASHSRDHGGGVYQHMSDHERDLLYGHNPNAGAGRRKHHEKTTHNRRDPVILTTLSPRDDARHRDVPVPAAVKNEKSDDRHAQLRDVASMADVYFLDFNVVPNVNGPDIKLDLKEDPPSSNAQESKGPAEPQQQAQDKVDKKETHDDTIISVNAVLLMAVVAACSIAGLVGLIVAGVCWYRLQRSVKASAEAEYPAYGVTGPTREKVGSPGDRKLAQSAQMYHYQHQKQQMLAMEKANGELNGNASDLDSEEENEEGDYTVYECPGLAPTGEMEVKNPLFNEDTSTATPSNGPNNNLSKEGGRM